ncbi:MAG TPA: 3-carboxy-cis,cis-muconate cycloisomerase [Candidatus Sulfotelmatobacter sp.]|jgi:3-carboxy-cis,cis-muconate cycloisomerase
MSASLIDSLATTEALAELFSDRSVLQAMLDFEIALARAEARIGIIPSTAAEAIAKAAKAEEFDLPALSRASLRAGTPTIPFVRALTSLVRAQNEEAGNFVHWGATSQDVSDTAMVLLLKRAQALIEDDLSRAERGLQALSEKHKNTVTLARTLLQPAPPITFGLKAAGWCAAIRRGRHNLNRAFRDALLLQLGGAVGTLAALADQGLAVAQALASDLGLTCPDAPWHTQRDRLANLLCACAVVTGSIGKIARDISLLMQGEIGEAAEPKAPGRGGSSTMPHKRNPIGCAVCLAAANRVPGLLASYVSSMSQEHERGVGGIQSEWATIAAIMQATGVAASSVAEIAEGMTIDPGRMRTNIDATQGTILAEKAVFYLAGKIGRERAHHLLEDATRHAMAEQRPLAEVLAASPEVARQVDPTALKRLFDAQEYLGSAEVFRQRLLATLPDSSKD